jgi:hypothetical protein
LYDFDKQNDKLNEVEEDFLIEKVPDIDFHKAFHRHQFFKQKGISPIHNIKFESDLILTCTGLNDLFDINRPLKKKHQSIVTVYTIAIIFLVSLMPLYIYLQNDIFGESEEVKLISQIKSAEKDQLTEEIGGEMFAGVKIGFDITRRGQLESNERSEWFFE